ncbi:MAG: NADH-quinone oxidoreductase subunit NuoN [Turneriella sp.]
MAITLNELLAMMPQLILVTGGLLVLTSQMLLKRDGRSRTAGAIAMATVIVALIVVVAGLSDATGSKTVLPRAFLGTDTVSAINNTFRYSAFSANALVVILTLAAGVLLLMRVVLPKHNIDFAENHFLVLMSVVGYAYAVCAEDLITLFVALELGTLPIVVLVGINRESRAANEAAVKYLLLSAFAIAFFLLGIALLYAANSTVRLRELREIPPHFSKTRVVVLAYLFMFAGFLFKLGAVPLHIYIADIYEGCTTVFTGLLASLSKVASVLVFFKVAMSVHDGYRQYLAPIITVAAVASMLYGSFAAIGTRNLKRILGYSSIGHAGYMLCFFVVPAVDPGAMGTIKQDAGSALYIYVAGYAAASLLAFGAIALMELRSGNPEVLTLENLQPAKSGRLVSVALGLSLLSFMGMPPLAGFFGKFFLFKYLALSGNVSLAAVAGLSSAVAMFAYVRVLRPLFFADTEPAESVVQPELADRGARAVLGVLGAVLAFFVVAAGFLYNMGVQAVHRIY